MEEGGCDEVRCFSCGEAAYGAGVIDTPAYDLDHRGSVLLEHGRREWLELVVVRSVEMLRMTLSLMGGAV